jgi:hypothetical protein
MAQSGPWNGGHNPLLNSYRYYLNFQQNQGKSPLAGGGAAGGWRLVGKIRHGALHR